MANKYMCLMTSPQKIELPENIFKWGVTFQFLLRLHYLIPDDGWHQWNADDFKLKVPQTMLNALFNLEGQYIQILLIVFNFAMIVMSFLNIKICYYYNNVLWHYFYIPQMAIFLNLEQGNNIAITLIGVFFLMTLTIWNIFFNRATKFIDKSPFVRKFTQLSVLIIFLDTMCIIHFEFHILEILLLHFASVIRCLEIILFRPYRTPLNKFVFKFDLLYLALTPIFTLFSFTTDDGLFYTVILLGTIFVALSDPLYMLLISLKSADQYMKLHYCQKLYKSSEIEKQINYCIHKSHCKQNHSCIEDVIICIMEQTVQFNQKHRRQYEILELGLISFLSTHKSTLKAYCRLKKYKNIQEYQTLFFKIGYPAMNHSLWKTVREIQKNLLEELRNKNQQYKQDDLKIKDLFRSNELQDQFLPRVLVVLDQKIDYFKNITINLTDMSRLLSNTLKLGQKIEGLQKWVNQYIFYKKRKNTIIELKILEIYYSFIMNDMVSANMQKKRLIEILQNEGNIQAGKLLNSSIMENKTILIFTSLVKNKGQIIKFNGNSLAKFWGYENEMDFRDIKHINQLMPEFFATVHDEYLDKFLNRGCSDLFDLSRTIFLCDKENLLIPAEIRIDNFTVVDDDYVITAGFSKNKENSLFLLFDQKGTILGVNHLFFKLLKQVDRSITPNDLNYGFVFQIIPKIFHLINIHLNNSKEFNAFEETVTLHLCNPIGRLFNKYGDCCRLSHAFSQLWVTIDDKSTHPNVEMFNQAYQQQMQNQIDISMATMNFDLVCTLGFMNIGCFKQLPLFILEITDLTKSNINYKTQSLTNSNSHSLSQRLQSQEIDLSSIQEESFKKVNNEGPEQQLYKEVNLIKGKYDQSYYDLSGFQDSSRQILAPSSQRAIFSNIKHKSLEDDSKILEEDFRYLRQQHDVIPEQVLEEEQSSEKPTKHQNIIGMIQKNRFKEQHEFEQVKSVNSMNSTEQNNKLDLVKQLYSSNNMPTYTKLIGLIDILIMLCILVSNLILIIFLQNNSLHALEQIETIYAPHKLNSYYCELYVHALTFQMNKFHLMEYSDQLLRDIEEFSRQKYIVNMTNLYSTFLTLEQQPNFPKINITYIDQPSLENVSFTYLFDQLIDKFQFVCNKLLNYSTYKLSESDLIKSLFLVSNLESTTKFNSQVVSLITISFFEDQNSDSQAIINLFLIQSGIEIVLLLIQLFCYQNIMNYYKKIMLFNCRIYEQDVHIILEKMYILRKIIIESKNINWKKSDYSGIAFQPLIEDARIKTHLKVQKTTMLTSRIQNTHLGIMQKVIYILTLLIVLISFNVGGFYFNKSQQNKLTPTQRLSSDFLEFTIQLDSLIIQSVRVKTQDIFINFIDLDKVITVKRDNIIPIIKYSQGAQYFVELFKSLTTNQIKMMKSLVEEIAVQNQEFYHLFFEDVFEIVSTNSADSKDNNREYAKNGIMGMYSSITKYITQSYNYELGSGKSDPDLENNQILINSDEFIIIFIRHFLNTKKVFNDFIGLLLEATKKEVIYNNFAVQIYYGFSIALSLLIFGLSFSISVRQQISQTKSMRLSLTTIPIELIDQQSVSILRKL